MLEPAGEWFDLEIVVGTPECTLQNPHRVLAAIGWCKRSQLDHIVGAMHEWLAPGRSISAHRRLGGLPAATVRWLQSAGPTAEPTMALLVCSAEAPDALSVCL
jgi:hypothetical protein